MNNLYIKFSNALEELLKERRPLIEPAPREFQPLFLLCTLTPDVVGFATLDGKQEESFTKAFQKFKDLHSIRFTQWADFDLTLVLCRTDIREVTDEFCNSVEMDPYFCRKFVIDLRKELEIELTRLPFIPLRPETSVGLQRPISAQTFLMKHGINSNLARYLAVPHARGTERIIEECVGGNLGKPNWLKAAIEELPLTPLEARPKIRLKDLEISSFRAYRDIYKFDLDADLVILFGPNGFGKTSFFDAIDFACTGGVARFDERFGRKTDKLVNSLKHLDSPINNSFVKIKASVNDEEILLERYMKDRALAYLGGETKDRTKTLMTLTGLLEEPPDLRIENLVRLFRATHLFGQEYQSLTSEFKDNSRLPEDIVSRMLALQDYVESINKAGSILGELRKRIEEKELETGYISTSIKSKKADMEKLKHSARILEKPESASSEGKKLGEKILRELNIPFEMPIEVNEEIIRSWRGMVEAEIRSIAQGLELIGQLENKLPDILVYRKKLEDKTLELNKKKESFIQFEKSYSEKKKRLEESEEKYKEMLIEEKTLLLKRENLNWFLKAKAEYGQLKGQIAKENKDFQNIQSQLLELPPRIGKIEAEKRAAEQAVAKIISEVKVLESHLRKIDDFKERINDWLKTLAYQRDLGIQLEGIEKHISDLKKELLAKKGELNNEIIIEDKRKISLDELQKSQSELKTLLDNIEKHIMNNVCPVCGTLHKSQEELMEKLKFQRGVQPELIKEALRLFEDSRFKAEELKKQVGALELKLKQSEQEYVEIQRRFSDVRVKIKNLEETAVSLNIPKKPEGLETIIISQRKDITDQINLKQQELSKQKSKVQKQLEELTSLVDNQKSLELSLGTIKSRLSQLQAIIKKIEEEVLTRQISLELQEETIHRDLGATNNAVEDLRKRIETSQAEYQNAQKEDRFVLERKNILEKEIRELGKEISVLKKWVEEVEFQIKKLNLDLDMEMNGLLSFKKGITERLSRLETLRTEVTNFEIILDALQTSAALAKIQQDMGEMGKQLQNKENGLGQMRDWLTYFNDISRELELLRNRAIKEYTGKFGPLTSSIQKRLRSVYGFGGIELYSERGGITVRVERKGEKNIHPSDFFSESQIQIVMLSLFLSAALTQTWSSFASIILDDPVTHFDDLNAYSFLDLIKGLIMESDMGNQFIISTCEDRLFRLMRQKFSRVNTKVISYVFESIGESGPKITKL